MALRKDKPGLLSRLAIKSQSGQDEAQLDLMMHAIKAVHSATKPGSTDPEDLARQRAGQELFSHLVTPVAGLKFEPFSIESPAGKIPAEWVIPEAAHARRNVILYCHGGGFTCGQLGYARILASKLALAAGCEVLSFEYRLAPENPYPAAPQDTMAVWDYLMYQGYGAHDVLLAGDSAGGNLALEQALGLKKAGRMSPRALILMSPWTDMTCSGKSYTENAAIDPMLTKDYIEGVRAAYTGADADWTLPQFSPLGAELAGLPPVLIQVGTHEMLRSDSTELARRITKAGGYARLEVYQDCWHVFQQMPIKKAAEALQRAGEFIRCVLES